MDYAVAFVLAPIALDGRHAAVATCLGAAAPYECAKLYRYFTPCRRFTLWWLTSLAAFICCKNAPVGPLSLGRSAAKQKRILLSGIFASKRCCAHLDSGESRDCGMVEVAHGVIGFLWAQSSLENPLQIAGSLVSASLWHWKWLMA